MENLAVQFLSIRHLVKSKLFVHKFCGYALHCFFGAVQVGWSLLAGFRWCPLRAQTCRSPPHTRSIEYKVLSTKYYCIVIWESIKYWVIIHSYNHTKYNHSTITKYKHVKLRVLNFFLKSFVWVLVSNVSCVIFAIPFGGRHWPAGLVLRSWGSGQKKKS